MNAVEMVLKNVMWSRYHRSNTCKLALHRHFVPSFGLVRYMILSFLWPFIGWFVEITEQGIQKCGCLLEYKTKKELEGVKNEQEI